MLKGTEPGAAEVAQWVGVFATKPDNLSSVTRIHTVGGETKCARIVL